MYIIRKVICCILLLTFSVQSVSFGHAQSVLPPPGERLLLSPVSHPPVLKGLKVYLKEPLRFDFVLDPGSRPPESADLKQESERLIRYFLAGLTIPGKDLWVNLSPYEKDRIIPEAFGQTEMGRDLLEQDYILKQLTASLLYPEGDTGKKFWQKVYALAQEKYGTTDIPIDTFNKVWIVPDKAVVYENTQAGAVYVTDSRLKVMLEQDYLATALNSTSPQTIARSVLREVLLPVLEEELDNGMHFSRIRQIYQSLVLAAWFKAKLKESFLGRDYTDQKKLSGIDHNEQEAVERIWRQYAESFRAGQEVIRDEYDPFLQETVVKKYVSGGAGFEKLGSLLRITTDPGQIPLPLEQKIILVSSNLALIDRSQLPPTDDPEQVLARIQEAVLSGDLQLLYQGIRTLLKMDIPQSKRSFLTRMINLAGPYCEIVCAYMLAQGKLFGVQPEAGRESLVEAMMKVPAETVDRAYYFFMNNYALERRWGVIDNRIDQKIYSWSADIDENARDYFDSESTWFSSLRQQIHRSLGENHLYITAAILRFWHTLNPKVFETMQQERHIDWPLAQTIVNDPDNRLYSNVLVRGVDFIGKNAGIPAGEDIFKVLLEMDEEEVLRSVQEANLSAPSYELEQVKGMLRLYFWLGKKYTLSVPQAREILRKASIIDGRMGYGKPDLLGKIPEYLALNEALDSADDLNILQAVVSMRRFIRRQLTVAGTGFPGEPQDYDTTGYYTVGSSDALHMVAFRKEIARLDYYLHVLGREYVNRVYTLPQSGLPAWQVQERLRVLKMIAGFVQVQGLGGVDFINYIDALDDQSLSVAQQRDVVLAMEQEVFKAAGYLAKDFRVVLESLLQKERLPELAPRWKDLLRSGELDQALVGNALIDEMIRDSGLDILKVLLTDVDRFLSGLPAFSPVRQVSSSENSSLWSQVVRFAPGQDPHAMLSVSAWGRKGANLDIMSGQDIPVPPGFSLSSQLGFMLAQSDVPGLRELVSAELEALRQVIAPGDEGLVVPVFVRSGSAFMLPGLLRTIANVGMNDRNAEELARQTNDPWFAYDTYASFLRSFGVGVLGIDETLFDKVLDLDNKDNFSAPEMKQAAEACKQVILDQGKLVPEDITEQVLLAVKAIYASWNSQEARAYRRAHDISDDWGTAVIVQGAVFGNKNNQTGVSGAGSASLLLDPEGGYFLSGEFRPHGQGDLIMTGADLHTIGISRSDRGPDSLQQLYPESYQQLLFQALHAKEVFGYEQLLEFVFEQGKLWITQSNDDVDNEDSREFQFPDRPALVRGKGLSGGAVRGWAANSLEKALELLEKYNSLSAQSDPEIREIDGVILVLDRVMPDIVSRLPPGIHLLARKLSVHAVSLAQHSGMTVVSEIPEEQMFRDARGHWVVGGAALLDGTLVSMDGHRNPAAHNTSGHVYHGILPINPSGSQKPFVQGGVDMTRVRESVNLTREGDGIHFEADPVLSRRFREAKGIYPVVAQMYSVSLQSFLGTHTIVF